MMERKRCLLLIVPRPNRGDEKFISFNSDRCFSRAAASGACKWTLVAAWVGTRKSRHGATSSGRRLAALSAPPQPWIPTWCESLMIHESGSAAARNKPRDSIGGIAGCFGHAGDDEIDSRRGGHRACDSPVGGLFGQSGAALRVALGLPRE